MPEELEPKEKNEKEKEVESLESLEKQFKIKIDELEKALKKKDVEFSAYMKAEKAKAKNPDIVKKLLDFEGDIDIDEQIKKLQVENSFLFEKPAEDKPVEDKLKGKAPSQSASAGQQKKNPFAKESFNLTEQMELYNTNQELYKVLKSQV